MNEQLSQMQARIHTMRVAVLKEGSVMPSATIARPSQGLRLLRPRGGEVESVREDSQGSIRGDLLALKPGEPILAVQATSGTNVSARIANLQDA